MDGQSDDRSADIVRDFIGLNPAVRLITNPKRTTPWAMNIGIVEARGSVIIKADAHSTFNPDYIPLAVKFLHEYQADDIGGVLETHPGSDTRSARAVACVLSNWFGAGNSYFRIGSNQPRWVDTVAYGCYRRDVFERIGLYNTNLARSQDIDLNRRLRKAGGRILLHPALRISYYSSPTLISFFSHNFTDGEWAIIPAIWGSLSISLRHMVPMALVLALVIAGILSIYFNPAAWTLLTMTLVYVAFTTVMSVLNGHQNHDHMLTPYIMMAYFCRHFGYGTGSIWGLIRLMTSRMAWRRLLLNRQTLDRRAKE
jgi:glycosyltransferase involved in cell wall biosynthesis